MISSRIVIWSFLNLLLSITVKLWCLLNNIGISVLIFHMMLLCNLAALRVRVWLHVLYALLFLCHFYHQSIELELMRIENTSNAYFVTNCWNYCSSNLLPTIRFYCISYVVSSDYKFNSFGGLHWSSLMKMEWSRANAPYFSRLAQIHICYVPAVRLLLYYRHGFFCGGVVSSCGECRGRGVFFKILRCNSVSFFLLFLFHTFK